MFKRLFRWVANRKWTRDKIETAGVDFLCEKADASDEEIEAAARWLGERIDVKFDILFHNETVEEKLQRKFISKAVYFLEKLGQEMVGSDFKIVHTLGEVE